MAAADPAYSADILDAAVQLFTDFEAAYTDRIVVLMETYGKPIFGVSLLTDEKDATVYRAKGHDLKAVFYETPERAAISSNVGCVDFFLGILHQIDRELHVRSFQWPWHKERYIL